MGLDELPAQQPIHKQQRVLSEDYLRKSASIGLLEKHSCYKSRTSRIKIGKQQEFKDVFGAQILKKDKQRNLLVPQKNENSSTTEAKMTSIRQQFSNAKNISMNEELWHSLEFEDVLEDLDSKKGTLPRYLKEPDSLLIKNLHDRQGLQPSSRSSCLTFLKSSYVASYRKNEICRNSEKKTYHRNILRPNQKLENDFNTGSGGRLDMDNLHKNFKSRLKFRDETCHSPARIVLLKPNFVKVQNAARFSFSPSSDVGFEWDDKNHEKFHRPRNGESYNEVTEIKRSSNDMEPSRHSFRVSRGNAKKTAQQIQHSISGSSAESRQELRGYSISANESEMVMLSCPNFVDWKYRNQISYPPSNGLSLAEEDKKQLLERREMTKSFQEVGAASRTCTLGEMLAIPDQETRPRNLNYKPDEHVLCSQFNMNGGNLDLVSPSAITSKDCWKDESVRNLSRSRPLHYSCNIVGSPKSRTRGEAFFRGWCLRREEAISGEENKSRKQEFSQRYAISLNDSKFSCEKPLSVVPFMDLESIRNIQETCAVLDELESKPEENDICEENPLVIMLSSSDVPYSSSDYDRPIQGTQIIQDDLENSYDETDVSKDSGQNYKISNLSVDILATVSRVADVVADGKTGSDGISSGISDQQQSGPTPNILLVKNGNCPSHVWDASTGQKSSIGSPEEGLVPSNCTKTDPEFPMSLGEAYQPSPNSVLEPSFEEEISSGSKCFESACADLQGLWMQLQLLKSESEDTHSETSGMLVSSDEDTGEGSVDLSDKNGKLTGLFRAEEGRDFSYLVDALDEAGFQGGNLEMGFETWYSPECPVSPSVFEALEKKYGKQTSWEKLERRLLFDRINAGLMEILNTGSMDCYMWSKPLRRRISSALRRDVVEEELWLLLVSQEKEVSKDLSEKALGKKMRWLDTGDDISAICTEMEIFLFNELAEEFASVLSI
ncbi:unnamed protein product [Ilex paraguariensis]|uniref:DUF4378 domain-containing protein n=1 Tax=Ilex paraguariensis TaxID=185542 RepID=A0ABC8SCY8_9AQUA